jgi:hypothetical protein
VIEAAGVLSSSEKPEGFYELVVELIVGGVEAAARRAEQER